MSTKFSRKYDTFVLSEFNRDVSKLDELRESMKQHGFIEAYPLHCQRDGNLHRIKGGHHRFTVAKELDVGVWYADCDDDATIQALEAATRPWKLTDYLTSYARVGSEGHRAIQEFSQRTGITSIQSASMLLGDSASTCNSAGKIKDGTFVVRDTSHAEAVGEVVCRCRDLGVSFAANRNFVSALSLMAKIPEFNAEKFLHKVTMHRHLMVKQSTLQQYLDVIEIVFNYASKDRVAIAFLAREAARSRQKQAFNRNTQSTPTS